MRQTNWVRVLTILLVILAAYAIVYITGTILLRFTQAILLFVLGAMLAYILNPLVNRLEAAFRFRWIAVLLAYLFVATGLFALGVLLFTPFVQQSQSLIDNLHNPSISRLVSIKKVVDSSSQLTKTIDIQIGEVSAGSALSSAQVNRTAQSIAHFRQQVQDLKQGTVSGPSTGTHPVGTKKGAKLPPNPPSQTRVPPSYVQSVLTATDRLSTVYSNATVSPGPISTGRLKKARTAAKQLHSTAASMYHTMATTPILLLHAQVWADDHGIKVDLHNKFGEAASQVSNQGTYILTNAITILSETANILLNSILILIISVYLVNDGGRLVRGAAHLVPAAYREQAWFFISSLDDVLGGYIRGQLFLSALAGVLGGGGAAVLGVPYPLLIGIMTFILESIPVIGPMVAVVPAVIISLFFNAPLTTVLLVVWFVVYQQVVTNILGPRVMGLAVGIHPLEALAAVLVGYPLGGLLGAFLAVPIAGAVHIFVREAYAYFALGKELPTAPVPSIDPNQTQEVDAVAPPESEPVPHVGARPIPDPHS